MGLILNPYRFGTGGPSFDVLGVTGLEAWYDASDESSIADTGGSVTQWNDKSGNGNHLVPGSSPTTGASTINSLNVITMTDPQYLTCTPSSALCVDDMTIYVVAHKTGTNATFETVPAILNAGNQGRPFDGYSGTLVVGGTQYPTGWFAVTSWTDPEAITYEIDKDGVSSGSHRVRQYVGTTLQYTQTATTTYSTTSQKIMVGRRDDGATTFEGEIAEIIICNAIHDTTEREDVQNYLIDKWNIT